MSDQCCMSLSWLAVDYKAWALTDVATWSQTEDGNLFPPSGMLCLSQSCQGDCQGSHACSQHMNLLKQTERSVLSIDVKLLSGSALVQRAQETA